MFKGEPKCRNRAGGKFLEFNVPSDIDKTREKQKGFLERERERADFHSISFWSCLKVANSYTSVSEDIL